LKPLAPVPTRGRFNGAPAHKILARYSPQFWKPRQEYLKWFFQKRYNFIAPIKWRLISEVVLDYLRGLWACNRLLLGNGTGKNIINGARELSLHRNWRLNRLIAD
jgi:hypothetical protein